MFVASRVETGDEGKAVVAMLACVIGSILTVTGRGTLRRENGVAIEAVVGDPVCRGDVIETASDGRIGIRFLDGTAFNLLRDTRVALTEFVCDADGAPRSALLAVTKGAFALAAGQMAETGSLRIDTPVGSIRGRAQAGGFGILSLTALTFSVMSEVQAADPDATFLDDDSITYKDLQHGAFELVTKEAIPRYIIVEDPGETVVLSRRGSSISVNQVANSAARMEELYAAQQDVLANFAKGHGPNGSGTPYFFNLSPLQPINYIQTDAAPAQNSLLPVLSIDFSVPEIIIVHPPPEPPVPPTLNAAAGPIEIDTVVFDNFTASSGTFVASSPRSGATLSYGISGGTAASTVLNGVTYDVAQAGLYGTLHVDSATGAYVYVPNSGAINALTAPTTETFAITVSDGTLSASQTFTVNINGTNDAAVISGATTGSVIEAGGVANATLGMPTATGTLTDTDVDDTPNTFTAVSSPKLSAAGYGTFTMSAAGVWAYTLDNTNSTVQALNAGDTLADSFTVTTVDGTAQVVMIAIHGAGDAAVISGARTGSVVEAGGVANATLGMPTATGTLTDTDVDNAPNIFTAVSSPTASDAGYGTFTMTAAGVWSYTLDNANSAVQALNAGDRLTDTFTVTTVDGTAQMLTIAINGTNDAAVVSGAMTGAVVEAGGVANAAAGTPTATGTLTDIDIDNPSDSFTEVSAPRASAGGYGTFTVTAAGVWTYTLDNANSAVQALNVGGTLTDRFTVSTVDGTAQVMTITITGANDAAIISGATAGSVIEAGGAAPGTPTATGTLTDIDVDNAANTFTGVMSPTESDGGYGTFTMTAAGAWTYTLDDNNSVVQALDVGDTLTDTFTVTTADGTAQLVTITIHGSSDADPNDFDYLALGSHEVSDPPFVYGTPGGDNIEGGGNDPQIVYAGAGSDTVNGTGKDDILYGGSGADTMKGNDGDDTIYGGSGADSINANNGNDTLIGGYGADHLTGSNGADRFVYLSVADSNAVQFDTITDFASGSDKIDLTALGAFAFLALTSSSTSVPPHTIAWLYNSASNQTIVYVNSTDQTLDIGDTALLEIHLQGVATIQEADFLIHEPATGLVTESLDLALAATAGDVGAVLATSTADGSSDPTVSSSARIADASWSLQTEDDGFSFHFARDRIDAVSPGKFADFEDASTRSSDDNAGDTVINPASESSIKPHYSQAVALKEDQFTFDQKPAHDSAAAMISGDGAGMPPAGTINHMGNLVGIPAPNTAAEHGAPPGGGSGSGQSHGQTSSIDSPGHQNHSDSIPTNAGSADPADAHVDHSKAAGAHGSPGSFQFTAELASSEHSSAVDHEVIGQMLAPTDHPGNAAGPHGPPVISETQGAEVSSSEHSAGYPHVVSHHAEIHIATHAHHDLIV